MLVATRDIDIGDEVTPNMVETAKWTPRQWQGHPFSDPSQMTAAAVFPIPREGGSTRRSSAVW